MDLFPLTEYNRNASLGRDYKELFMNYPNWSYDLHAHGNTIDNSKLNQIAKEGLMFWYLQNEINYDISYDYIGRINKICGNLESLSYYDFIHLTVDLNKNPNNLKLEKGNSKFMFLSKYFPSGRTPSKINQNLQRYCTKPFYYFVFEKVFCNDKASMKEFFESIKNDLYEIPIIRSKLLFGLFERYPEIETWGIIFQKFKVILEKISYSKKYEISKIYKIDKFVDKIQQHIYSIIKYYCLTEEKLDTRSEFTLFLENPKLLESYSLEDSKLDWIFDDPIFKDI